MATDAHHTKRAGGLVRVLAFLKHEFLEILPPTIFFFIGFNLILFTQRLVLSEYLIQYAGFFIATTSALIVGKVVLVADAMPFMRRFDYAPLAYPILFKAVVYTLTVLVARLLEALIHYLFAGGVLGGGRFYEHLVGQFSWPRFIAVQLWIFTLFLVYVTGRELNELFGDGELFKIFFTRRSTMLKSVRRARIRLLIRLARLTGANPIETLEDRGTPAHAELIGILRDLAGPAPGGAHP